ncbi:Uu.00g074480.m01.CDS01 [Anthostomella pinea]|uniref:Uu.00g074480.m01.CDS01 n=1 Tax=Anthostomella pinea TaxID=933095 RepID=A0AAI8YP10_9PEZI|nr:Uu.00g074480.m01.CDS01 [Anthostomella pinea]
MRFSLFIVAATALTGTQAAVASRPPATRRGSGHSPGLFHDSGAEDTVDACAMGDSDADESSKLRRASSSKVSQKRGTVERRWTVAGTLQIGRMWCKACDGTSDDCRCPAGSNPAV